MKKLIALLALALVVAACGDAAADEPTSTSSTLPRIGGRVSVGAPISVEDALASDGSAPVLVTGYLFVLEDGTVLLADMILESYPPQPGGARIVVDGLSVEGMALEQADPDGGLAQVKWTEYPYEVLGTVQGGVLIYYDNPTA